MAVVADQNRPHKCRGLRVFASAGWWSKIKQAASISLTTCKRKELFKDDKINLGICHSEPFLDRQTVPVCEMFVSVCVCVMISTGDSRDCFLTEQFAQANQYNLADLRYSSMYINSHFTLTPSQQSHPHSKLSRRSRKRKGFSLISPVSSFSLGSSVFCIQYQYAKAVSSPARGESNEYRADKTMRGTKWQHTRNSSFLRHVFFRADKQTFEL